MTCAPCAADMGVLNRVVDRVRVLARHRSLAVTGAELTLLGHGRAALDIGRLSEELQVHKRIVRRYGAPFDAPLPEPSQAVNKTVWVCWLQGMEGAPELVQRCFESVRDHFAGWNIVVLTSEDFSEYAQLPAFIVEKWRRGAFGAAHFTDLLRVDLLTRLGGLWLDATVLCTGTLSDAFLEKNDLFLFQILPPNALGRSIRASSWLIWAKAANPILAETRRLLWRYWEKEDALFDYFLLHHFMALAMERHPEEARRILPASTTPPHTLQFRLFEPYDEDVWAMLVRQSDFHKLTYRIDPSDAEKPGTFYARLIGKELAQYPQNNVKNGKS